MGNFLTEPAYIDDMIIKYDDYQKELVQKYKEGHIDGFNKGRLAGFGEASTYLKAYSQLVRLAHINPDCGKEIADTYLDAVKILNNIVLVLEKESKND